MRKASKSSARQAPLNVSVSTMRREELPKRFREWGDRG